MQTNLSLGQAFANGLTFLPETPPEDNTSLVGEIVGNSRPQQRITVAEQSKTPVQGAYLAYLAYFILYNTKDRSDYNNLSTKALQLCLRKHVSYS